MAGVDPIPGPDPADLHRPVLLNETLDHLSVTTDDHILDCTCGMGGHSAALLAGGARVTGVDRDPEARRLASERLAAHGERFQMRAGTYAEAVRDAVDRGERFDGVLADLGVSSLQLDDGDRGFSIRSEAPLDLRMDPSRGISACELLDRWSEEELALHLREWGEERFSGRVARVLKERRAEGAEACVTFADAIRKVVPGRQQRHPALRAFQALRIAVNDELGQLDELLALLPDLLTEGGRAVIISFHSLEDRRVKNAFRDGRRAGLYGDAARKVVTAGAEELAVNRRAAPAKLRWARRGPISPAPVKDLP
jgi:16S rRNA (cytosine1402-N4)-methyltransferase